MSELHIKMSKMYLNTVWKEIPGEDFGYEGILDGLRVGFAIDKEDPFDLWCWVKSPTREEGPYREFEISIHPSQDLFKYCARVALGSAISDVMCDDGVLEYLREVK